MAWRRLCLVERAKLSGKTQTRFRSLSQMSCQTFIFSQNGKKNDKFLLEKKTF
jgi:hypothetical protein